MEERKTITKRLDKMTEKNEVANGDSKSISKKTKSSAFFTKTTADREKSIEEKIKLLHGNFFGKPIVKFEVTRMTDVWVPYCYLEYDFKVERHIVFKKKGLRKQGEVAVVFDMNEMHPFQYDIYESGDIPLLKSSLDALSDKAKMIKCDNSFEEIENKAKEYIQFKVMKRFYGSEAKLLLRKKKMFYRPAVEMEVIYKGENPNMRYVYLDEFGVESEHILGLKYRVDNNF
ncbi:MAG: hypothetical protein GX663_00430 [Clostridiales bacterium]|nr:hypothetical protein [Clostridiales bacterium]